MNPNRTAIYFIIGKGTRANMPPSPFTIDCESFLTQLPPSNIVSMPFVLPLKMTQHTFRCPTKNPNPNVSVVNVILLPLGTVRHQHKSRAFPQVELTIKHIALHCMHLLSRLVRDIEFAINDDLHLMVCVFVDQRRAFLQSIESRRDRSCWIVGLGCCNVAEEGVLVGNQGWLELGLRTGVVCEFERGHS
jgi:hypothetical protein